MEVVDFMAKQLISKAVGIDLGTTNSAVAIMNPTDTELLLHRDATTKRETIPSCVWKDPRSGEIVVGRKAFARIGTNPSPIRSIKRKMGRQEYVQLVNEQVTPEEVSAHILRAIKQQIETDVARFSNTVADWQVDRAIITVPAYFDMPQIEATRKAGELADLQILELLHEPTAAACYHCFRSHVQNGVFMVYDLGGGTFDVSILRCTAGAFEVLGISGNNYLGGDDIDVALARYLLQQLQQQDYSLDLDLEHDPEDRLRFDKLKLIMEGVKKALSTHDDFLLRDAMSLRDKEGNWVEIESQFERSEIEALMSPIVQRTIAYCHEALEKARAKAGITLADVDAIILAGGSTHIPLVRELVRTTFCADPTTSEPRARCTEPVYENVDSIVALGAAIRAAVAGGLIIYNPERTVRVMFQGIGATSSTQAHFGGRIEALDPAVNLKDGYVRLILPGLNIEDQCDLSDSGAFRFTRIQLQPTAHNLLQFEIYDAHDALLATVNRSVTQDPKAAPTGIQEGTAVLAKPLSLEVIRAGNITRTTLVQESQTLPVKARYSFTHPGNTEHVRFALYQKERKIKEVLIDVPATTAKGTPIDFSIEVDKLATISCSGIIGTIPFQFQVRAPEERTITVEDINSLEQRFNSLPAEQQNPRIKEQFVAAKERAVNAVQAGDQSLAEHELEELEGMFTNLGTQSLRPPQDEFLQLVQTCLDLIDYADAAARRSARPFEASSMRDAIQEQRRLGMMAFTAGDQQTYTTANEMLNNMANHMYRLIQTQLPLSMQAEGYIRFLRNEIEKYLPQAQDSGRSDLESKLIGINRRLDELARNAGSDPSTVISKLRSLDAEVATIARELSGDSNSFVGDRPVMQ